MYIVLLVFVSLISSGCLAEFVITAHEREELGGGEAPTVGLGFNMESLLKKYGYPFENHGVITEDGYVLALHRIPYGRNSSETNETKPAVLIVHGIGSSSGDFVVLGPERSLPLMLADLGYDVWLGNNRGNTWSRKHQTLDADKNSSFWDFSFDELSLYDTPAMIDHVLTVSRNEKLSYVGHSQGTTQFFALASQQPDYNDKVNVMMALGPAVYCGNMSNPIVQFLKDYYTVVELLTSYLNLTEILPHSLVIETALKLVCKDGGEYQEACPIILFILFGFDSDQLNRSDIKVLLDTFPAGFAIKELKHYLQLVKSNTFRQFDYGILNNMAKYNKSSPPEYNVSLVTAPVALYYGQNDWLVGMADVNRLADELPNVVEKRLIDYEYFNHIDFILAKDVASMLYFNVINKLNEINGFAPIISTSTLSTSATSTTNESGSTTSPDNTTSTEDGGRHTGSASSLNKMAHIICIFVAVLIFVI
ncbi:hypothetical protein NQ315_007549 [Exocentrus adspersus]|uniref:Partial AB-hydrolase lipase domain-containing protein n=1 Tax=Exocentrus adspersus TaxID=1586481 RepID=A0AAV8W7T4_9CUCU|nr:hypothetical protein NQ315_007549 [Exocentrus adspersus]